MKKNIKKFPNLSTEESKKKGGIKSGRRSRLGRRNKNILPYQYQGNITINDDTGCPMRKVTCVQK